MICSKCGNTVNDNAKFCVVCGNQIISNQVNQEQVNQEQTYQQQAQQQMYQAQAYQNQIYQNQVNQNAAGSKKSNRKLIIIGSAVATLIVTIIAVVVAVIVLGDDESNNNMFGGATNPFAGGLSVGSTVYFGRYEQDNNTNNGAEPILWDVIGQNEDGFLLLSHYVIDCKPFQEGPVNVIDYATGVTTTGVTWETSSIRKWLNEDFKNGAFNANEKTYIVPVVNITTDFKETLGQEDHYASMKGGVGGGNTNDNVFLLSIEDYMKYLKPTYLGHNSQIYASIEALAGPTKYARIQGASIDKYDDALLKRAGCQGTFDADYNGSYTYWLLRNSGSAVDNVTVMSVASVGHVAASQRTHNPCGIRPAIWVKASANGNGGNVEDPAKDAYSQCIGYWKPKNVDSLSPDTFWLHSPQVMEITETSVIVHGPNYRANREDLQHAERGGIHYFTSREDGFRFYYSSGDKRIVLEIKNKEGNWIRWADFE